MSNGRPYGTRHSILYPAQIDAGGDARIPCRLHDVSASGACILVPAGCDIPDEFVLLLAPSGAARRYCRVIRREANELGVLFERPHRDPPADARSQQPPPPPPPPQQPDDIVKLDS